MVYTVKGFGVVNETDVFLEFLHFLYDAVNVINLISGSSEYIMWNARLDESQAGIKIAGRNINYLKYGDDAALMAESEEERKSLLMKVKGESQKAGLKLNIQKTKIMASGPITSWEMGEKVEMWQILFSWALKSLWKVTAAMKLQVACWLEGKLWQT